jgi:hypothetical protein
VGPIPRSFSQGYIPEFARHDCLFLGQTRSGTGDEGPENGNQHRTALNALIVSEDELAYR